MQLALLLPRAKALELTGFSRIVFMFMTDCKWNKIPPCPPGRRLWRGAQGSCLGKCPLIQNWCLADTERPRVLVPWPWEGKPVPASNGALEFSLDAESTQDSAEGAASMAWHQYQSQVHGLISHSRQLQDGASFLWRGKLARGAGSHHGTSSSGRGRGQDSVFNLFLVYLSL